jgi:Ca2+-binding EF-hand superfamily protein
LAAVLGTYKKQLGSALIELDPGFSGFITADLFESMLSRFAKCDPNEVELLIGSYDPMGTGVFNYFTLLSDLCNQTAAGGSPSDGGRPSGGGGRNAPAPERYEDERPSPPKRSDPPARKTVNFDETANSGAPSPPRAAKPTGPSRALEICRHIADNINKVFDSSQAAFHKWRGGGRTMTAEEFAAGVQRDFKIDMTVEEAQELISRFDNNMTLGNFMKMLSSGGVGVGDQAKVDAAAADEVDQWLLSIARQCRGKDWENILRHGRSLETICTALKQQSIFITPPDLRPAITRYGQEGAIVKIKELMGAL